MTRTPGAGRQPTIPYSLSRRTCRSAADVLADIARLEVPGTELVARGSTHVVLAPAPSSRYGAGTAVAVGIAITLGVLVAAAASVTLIVLLPVALLPGAPLLLRREPRVGIGAVEDDGGDTVVTVSGDMWSALAVALHSCLAALPPPRVATPATVPDETAVS